MALYCSLLVSLPLPTALYNYLQLATTRQCFLSELCGCQGLGVIGPVQLVTGGKCASVLLNLLDVVLDRHIFESVVAVEVDSQTGEIAHERVHTYMHHY